MAKKNQASNFAHGDYARILSCVYEQNSAADNVRLKQADFHYFRMKVHIVR